MRQFEAFVLSSPEKSLITAATRHQARQAYLKLHPWTAEHVVIISKKEVSQ